MVEPPQQRPRPRIESLSDLVFGLTLSIGAIALVSNPPTNEFNLYRGIATFTFNFIVLISSGIFLVSAVPLFGRVDIGGVLVTGFSLRMALWLLAVLIAWLSMGIRRASRASDMAA